MVVCGTICDLACGSELVEVWLHHAWVKLGQPTIGTDV
jgi:hypothetical protein